MKLFRDKYNQDKALKKIVDHKLSKDSIISQINELSDNIEDNCISSYNEAIKLLSYLKLLIDSDLVQTIRDRIQTPKYQLFSEEKFVNFADAIGFSSWNRVTKTPNYKIFLKL